MNILVTGAGGFIGSRVLQQLLAQEDVHVTALVRAATGLGRWDILGLDRESPRLHVERADLCDDDAVRGVLRRARPETLIHLAMTYHPLGAASDGKADDVNLHAALRLHHAFIEHGGRRYVCAGTCFEYGHQRTPLIREDAECRPIYDYAISKARATESALDEGARSGTEALALRVFAPYGPLEQPQRIVPQLIDAGRRGRRLDLSPGEQVRDYTFVNDVAKAFVVAARHTHLPAAQAVYNACTGIGHSLRELAASVSQALGCTLDLHWGALAYRPDEMMRLVGDNSRIARDLGWKPTHALAEGLRRTAQGAAKEARSRAA
jgi:nucleoside-diphosphate-sugar epimerase